MPKAYENPKIRNRLSESVKIREIFNLIFIKKNTQIRIFLINFL